MWDTEQDWVTEAGFSSIWLEDVGVMRNDFAL